MCGIARISHIPTSVHGYKQTFSRSKLRSALPPTTDIRPRSSRGPDAPATAPHVTIPPLLVTRATRALDRALAGPSTHVRPKFFGGGKFGGRSFGAVTQEGNCASAPDPEGGCGVGSRRSAAPALDTSTAHPPVMPATNRAPPARICDRAHRFGGLGRNQTCGIMHKIAGG